MGKKENEGKNIYPKENKTVKIAKFFVLFVQDISSEKEKNRILLYRGVNGLFL